jgi:hypothetical protein
MQLDRFTMAAKDERTSSIMFEDRRVIRRINDTHSQGACPPPLLRIDLSDAHPAQPENLTDSGIFIAHSVHWQSGLLLKRCKHAETGRELEEIFDRR